MPTSEVNRQRITLRIEFDLESNLPRIDNARRMIEMAAAEVIESTRDRLHSSEPVRISSCAMRSSAGPVPKAMRARG